MRKVQHKGPSYIIRDAFLFCLSFLCISNVLFFQMWVKDFYSLSYTNSKQNQILPDFFFDFDFFFLTSNICFENIILLLYILGVKKTLRFSSHFSTCKFLWGWLEKCGIKTWHTTHIQLNKYEPHTHKTYKHLTHKCDIKTWHMTHIQLNKYEPSLTKQK